MTQLDELNAFIRRCLPERLIDTVGADAWMDGIRLASAPKDCGLNQRRVGIRRYNASLAWERWPYRQYDPDVLFALVMVWLIEHDGHDPISQEPIEPDVFVELIDDENAIVVITLPLTDDIIIKEDAQGGVIPLKGKQYSVVKDARADIATSAWVFGANNVGAPTGVE